MNNFKLRYIFLLAFTSAFFFLLTTYPPYRSNSPGRKINNLFTVKHSNQKNIVNTVEATKELNVIAGNKTNLVIFEKKKIRIVFYTLFADSAVWSYFRVKQNNTVKCEYDFKCELIYDINQFENADIVFFHARNMPSNKELDILKDKVKSKKQYWVYFSLDNPYNNPPIKPIAKYFDFVSTYRLNSDFQFPYAYSRLLLPEEQTVIEAKNYAKGKTKKVAWILNNCGLIREELAARFLQHGLPMDVGGKYSLHYANKMKCASKECLGEYKFYFAAENNFCNEYITDNYWEHSLGNELVPIVLGGSNYSDPKLAIPGSFINALDFKTPKDLVDHINKVDANDTLYNEYFSWKKSYKIVVENHNGCSELLNNFCNKLHNGILIRKDSLILSVKEQDECAENEIFYMKWVSG